MADIPQLQKQFLNYVASLFNEEVLDEQFIQVHRLKPVDNPNFAVQLLTYFFKDAETMVTVMTEMLVGAAKIKSICSEFREACDNSNDERLTGYVRQLHSEIAILKSKLEIFFYLEKLIQDAEGEVPPIKLKTVCDLENVKPTQKKC
uniref:Histidine-containing phosphotransfer protein n=1 Tax=Kalanchoe fedtschenkoi TaxID=63787 RepID=A0A7N0ZRM2_KALFE